MSAPVIVPAIGASQMDSVRALLRDYHAQLGVDLCFQDFEAELRNLPGDYAPPHGRLWLARVDSDVAGCVALRALDGARCEMKRLFVRPQFRGLGIGRALVSTLLAEARAIGYTEIVLDTLPSMHQAQRLYEGFGFHDIQPYYSNPVAGTRYLGRAL